MGKSFFDIISRYFICCFNRLSLKGICSRVYILKSLNSVINDKEWIENKFVKKVAKRGGEIIQVKNLSSSASAANSICDHIHDWLIGTKNGELVSMGVISDNNPYNIPANLCFSFPLICDKGNWEIVKGYKFDEFGKNKI